MHDGTGPQRPGVPGDGWVEVDLPFPGVRQFEDEFAPNLATDGLFIPTPDPLPPSTVVRFHVTLPDDFVLLEGTGIVVWAREPGDPSGAPPGMSLRFATLSQHYQDLLDRIVQTHVERGGTPFEVEPRVGDAQFAAGVESPSPAARGVASERPRLTVRRAGAPDAMAPSAEEGGRAAASVSGIVGPLDRTVSLPPPGAGPPADDGSSVDVASTPTSPSASDVDVNPPAAVEPPPDAFWPPWEAEVSRVGGYDVVDRVDTPALRTTDLAHEDVEGAPVERFEVGRVSDNDRTSLNVPPSGLPDELFSDDLDGDSKPREPLDPGDSTPVLPSDDSLIEAERPRRRWSMGRTIATLAAAIVVVGVVAVLVLSPWSRLVDPEESEGRGVVATGDVAPSLPAVDQPEEPAPEETGADTTGAAQASGTAAAPVEPAEAAGTRPDAPPSPERDGPPASRVESITWEDVGGTTRVTLRGNGRLLPDRVAVIPMASPPRVLIRIRHIEARYESYVLETGTPAVTAIRTGLHPELTPPALYVVCDLGGEDVRVLDSAFDGDALTVTLGS